MNLFIFNGTICRDIEMKYTQNQGMSVISNSLAFNKKDANGNQSTVFLDFVAFGKTAELINEYYQKGDMLCGVGEISADEWQDKDTGAKRVKHKIIIQKLEFTKSPKAWAGNSANNSWNSGAEAMAQNIANSGAVLGVSVTNYANGGGNSSLGYNQAPQNYGQTGAPQNYNQAQNRSNSQPQNLAQDLDEIPF